MVRAGAYLGYGIANPRNLEITAPSQFGIRGLGYRNVYVTPATGKMVKFIKKVISMFEMDLQHQ